MKYRPRIYYTDAQKELMWDRWQKGDSQEKIAQLFDRGHGSVARILVQTGGIRPPKRTRSKRALSLAEREEISRGVVAGRSLRSIAVSLNRAPSTVSREISRNGGRQHYRANVADKAAWDRAHRAKTCKLVRNPALARIVARQATARVVTATDRWVAETHVPRRRDLPGVTRDHLSNALYPGPRSLEERAVAALEAHPQDASFTTPHAERQQIMARSPVLSRSASDRPRLRIVPYRVTGKVTSCSAARTARSQPWLSVIAATCCSPESKAKTPRR